MGAISPIVFRGKILILICRWPEPDAPNYMEWKAGNELVMSWLKHSIEPEISSSLILLSTAKEVWDHVHELFSKGNDARIYQLKQQIATMKQGDSSVTSFYTSLRTLWEELAFYQPLPTCSCGVMQRCKCDFLYWFIFLYFFLGGHK